MADLKISQLSSATALAGTEVVPVVQGGATKKATIDQILSPASGKGINFSAAGGDTLAIYDEGTFTPGFTNLTIGNGTLFGTFRRIGKQVFVTFGFICGSTTSVGTLTGITGLPFTTGTIGAGRFFAANGTAFKSGVGWYGAYAALFTASTSGSGPVASATDVGMSAASPFVWAADDSLSLTATYFTD